MLEIYSTYIETHAGVCTPTISTLNQRAALILPRLLMALKLYIPPCIHNPAHALHPPPLDRPLRVQIEGPLVSIQKLVPDYSWHFKAGSQDFPQPGGEALAKLTFQALYRIDIRQDVDMIVRDEYLGWVMEGKIPKKWVFMLSVIYYLLVIS